MRAKTRIRISLAIVSAALLFCVAFGVAILKQNVKAEAATTSASALNPKMTIESNNVSYSDSIYIIYAVSNEGFDRTENPIRLLFWEEPQTEYVKGTEKAVAESQGIVTLDGNDYSTFYSRGIAAKEMTKNLYARPYTEIDGQAYYGEMRKCSVLEYVYTMREKEKLTDEQTNMFDVLLQYGAAAQRLLNYDTDRLATATYYTIECVNGTISDGTTFGRYVSGEQVVLNADAAPTGKTFSCWTDELGTSVGENERLEITVTESKTYTAVYKDLPSEGGDDSSGGDTCLKHKISNGTATVEVTENGTYNWNDNFKQLFDAGKITWIGSNPASCTEYATVVASCSNCHSMITFSLSGQHNYESVVTPPTCKEQGYTTYTCVACGKSYVGDYVEKTSQHKISNGTVTVEVERNGTYKRNDNFKQLLDDGSITWTEGEPANCTEYKTVVASCSNCQYMITFSLSGQHERSAVGVVTPPTCKEQGYTTYTCVACGDSCVGDYVEKTSKHKISNGTVTVEVEQNGTYEWNDSFKQLLDAGSITQIGSNPTSCTKYAMAMASCSNCQYMIMFSLSGQHDYESVVISSTDTTHSYTKYTCKDCGYSYEVINDGTAAVSIADYATTKERSGFVYSTVAMNDDTAVASFAMTNSNTETGGGVQTDVLPVRSASIMRATKPTATCGLRQSRSFTRARG